MTQQRTVHRLRRQASQDALTGLLNRGAFVEAASAQLKTATLTDSDIGLLLFDLDRFKEVNDSHGHAAGDAVLVAFAEILRRSLRQTDVIGRIGGEEFAALLTGVDARRANLIAEGIRLELARLAIDHAGTAIATTVSVGLTIARARETGLTSLMERTDGALYMAKRGGRDRVETAPA
nr:GGDEF domain-containing protein [Kaistia hirudinis]